MKRLVRRLSSGIYTVEANANRDVIPSIVLTRPSEASIFQFTNDRDYFRMLDIKVQGTRKNRTKIMKSSNKKLTMASLRRPVERDSASAIFEADDDSVVDDFECCNAKDLDTDDEDEVYACDDDSDDDDDDDDGNNNEEMVEIQTKHRNDNSDMLARLSSFMSIMYAISLIIFGAMCTMMNVREAKNSLRDWFVVIVSIIGFGYLLFLHYDIIRYKKWMLSLVVPLVNENNRRRQPPSQRYRVKTDDTFANIDNFTISTSNTNNSSSLRLNQNNNQNNLQPPSPHSGYNDYDKVSLSTAVIFDFFQQTKTTLPTKPIGSTRTTFDTTSADKKRKGKDGKRSKKDKVKKEVNKPDKKFTEFGYRFFLGKHSNDFYLKTGMIIFCFGNILHIGIEIVQQIYFYIHKDEYCQNFSELAMNGVCFMFSFYQLFMAFKYSSIIINRYPNVARFALMHLLGTCISIWLDTITDEAVSDYIMSKLSASVNYHGNDSQRSSTSATMTTMLASNENDDDDMEYRRFLEIIGPDSMFRNNLIQMHNCSHLSIINYHTLSAIPYLYPFTIEYNIALASIWYMIWINIGNVSNKSLFYVDKSSSDSSDSGSNSGESYDNHPDDDRTQQYDTVSNYRIDVEQRNVTRLRRKNYSLSLNIDCHASNRGLFFGLAILLITIITIVIFFSTIKKDVYKHFGVMTYSLQIALLTICCFVIIPIAFYKMQQLDVVKREHRDNSFTMMHDILILIPIPFYIVHYSISIIANLGDDNQEYRDNNHLLVAIDLMTIVQVVLQSPFIVDGLRRCSNQASVRYRKPGRELITLCLILNVTLWILNTFELKSVEVYHATHYYFGEFFGMLVSHTTLPFMLFYRFHSSVCLSNIWKYAYERDEP